MLWKGMAMSWRMGGALSPVLPISQGLVYAVIPLSALYMFVHLLARLVTLLRAGPVAEDPLMLTLTLFGVMLVLFMANVPIPIEPRTRRLAALLLLPNVTLEVIVQRMFFGLDSFVILSVPLFMLLGELMEQSKITERLVAFVNVLVGRLSRGARPRLGADRDGALRHLGLRHRRRRRDGRRPDSHHGRGRGTAGPSRRRSSAPPPRRAASSRRASS